MKRWLLGLGLASFLATAGRDVLGADEQSPPTAMPKPAANPNIPSESILERVRRGEMMRERVRKIQERLPQAKLPADLAALPMRKVPGRTNLELVEPSSLGKPLTSDEWAAIIDRSLAQPETPPLAAACSDEQFVRRAFLDVIGRLPGPRDVTDFVADRSPDKKERLVNYLLDQPAYGVRWGRYWRDVISYHATAGNNRNGVFNVEGWLAEQLNANRSWADIVTSLLTATGLSNEAPAGAFMAAHEGKPEELAGETARIFLGLQISCAQCHDHPTTYWKRDQFHELAAFFGRVDVRPRIDLSYGPGGPIIEVSQSIRFRDYMKPDAKDPAKPGTSVLPAFLSGQELPRGTTDAQRRQALATLLTSQQNPFFAKAFVNRMWAELTGTGFVMPVDDLQSLLPVSDEPLFDALSRSFAASGYDIKELMRLIMTSKRYDRISQEPKTSPANESATAHLAAATEPDDVQSAERPATGVIRPTRLPADLLFDALDDILGQIDDGLPSSPRRPNRRRFFQAGFGFDPSTHPDEVEGSIAQALALSNSPMIENRIDASRQGTLLHKILPIMDDAAVIRLVYLKVLSREPKAEEVRACLAHRRTAGSREKAFEDILWALLNSTEFLTRH